MQQLSSSSPLASRTSGFVFWSSSPPSSSTSPSTTTTTTTTTRRASSSRDDCSTLLRRSPKSRNEEYSETIHNHARRTMQRSHYCSSVMRTASQTRFKTSKALLPPLLVGTIVFLRRSGMDILQSVVQLSKSMGVLHYESNIYAEHFRSFLDEDIRPDYFPFLLNGNTLLCPRVYREFIISGRPRIKAAIEMIHTGVELSQHDDTNNLDMAKRRKRRDPLPILVVNLDQSGCNTTTHRDDYDFPRLTWSIPALKHHMEWCQAVPMPSYETWRDYSKKHTTEESWDATFALESTQYPWENKTNVALWRGTTTYDYNYTGHELNDTPRGRLVRLSMKHPALIDAGFVRLNQQYENATFTEENSTILTERMKFDDMMKYKAVIDIDGNDWSSRFPKLLCTNSVVIKIEPNYIEYFYHELQPMVHYVPASLENLTQVVDYVLYEKNELEMRGIVNSANSWCRTKMIKKRLATDMMSQLDAYEVMLNNYLHTKNISDESLALSLLQCGDFIPCF